MTMPTFGKSKSKYQVRITRHCAVTGAGCQSETLLTQKLFVLYHFQDVVLKGQNSESQRKKSRNT